MKTQIIFFIFIFCLFCQCSRQNKDIEVEAGKSDFLQEQNLVDVTILSSTTFSEEIISNGKLISISKSDLQFTVGEVITEINAANGSAVKQGQIIARLNDEELQRKYLQSQIKYENARLELQDFFLSHAQLLADTISVEGRQKLRIAEIRSGLAEAKLALEVTEAELQAATLKAPFSGKLSNLHAKVYDHAKPGEVFCTVIDDSRFEVVFKVIESEVLSISVGKQVQLLVHSNGMSLSGKISEINPMVDEHGLVTVKAVVNNPGGLFEGMNVKVHIKSEIPEQLIVPKTSVVLRQNQEVLFKYQNGIAFWTYVQTLHENSDSYSVIAHPDKTGSLATGDTVIISGNLNLAHESEVKIGEFLR